MTTIIHRLNYTVLALLALIISTPAAHADLYSYVDRGGVTHIADHPLNPKYRLVKHTLYNTATPNAPTLDNAAQNWDMQVNRVARQYGVDPLLVHAVIGVESGYNPRAVSPRGAQGLMQLMPATGQRFGATALHNPTENLEAGTRYLKWLLRQFNGDVSLAVAAYNAGEGAVQRFRNAIPPYAETQAYVKAVLARYRVLGGNVLLSATNNTVEKLPNGRVRITLAPSVNNLVE